VRNNVSNESMSSEWSTYLMDERMRIRHKSDLCRREVLIPRLMKQYSVEIGLEMHRSYYGVKGVRLKSIMQSAWIKSDETSSAKKKISFKGLEVEWFRK